MKVGHKLRASFCLKQALLVMLCRGPAPSASQITPRQSSPRRLRASHFAAPSGFARLRQWLAEAKSRQSRDEDWWAFRACLNTFFELKNS